MQLQQHYKMTPVSINWTPFINLLMQYQRACLEQAIAIPLVHKLPQFYQAMLWHNTLKSYNTYENTRGLPPRTLYLSSPYQNIFWSSSKIRNSLSLVAYRTAFCSHEASGSTSSFVRSCSWHFLSSKTRCWFSSWLHKKRKRRDI